MKPREIRQHILAEHASIRDMLNELEQSASRVLSGHEDESPALRDLGLSFHSKFSKHLAFEDRHLAPVLREAGADGIQQSEHLADDHREQRELLDYILANLRDPGRPARLVADQLQGLVELIRDDMASEETSIVKGAALDDADPAQA